MAIAKIACVGALCTAGLVGIYIFASSIIKPATKDLTPEPNWRAASEDKGADSDYGKSTYANKYQKYLVGVKEAKEGASSKETNEEWWKETYKKKYKAEEATGGFSSEKVNDANSLKIACQKAYKGTFDGATSEIKETGNETVKYKETQVWQYCSSGGTKPKAISEQQGEEAKYTSKNSYGKQNKEDLISVDATDIDWVWKLKEKELKEAIDLKVEESVFKKLKDKLRENQVDSPSALKDACRESYKQDVSDATTGQYIKTEILKFCSLTGNSVVVGA